MRSIRRGSIEMLLASICTCGIGKWRVANTLSIQRLELTVIAGSTQRYWQRLCKVIGAANSGWSALATTTASSCRIG
ncbi:hypothetical protein D3C81_1872940 [compost metagenome]